LIRATKGVTLATAKAVSAGNSAKAVSAGNSGKQEDVVQAANVGRRYCTELLVTLKVSCFRDFKERLYVKFRDT